MADEVFRSPTGSASPWHRADYSFAGWVPNVSGHLSFNQVDPRGRQTTLNHQPSLDEPRTVVARRTRIAQDYPWWDWLVGLFRPAARQDYIVLGESGHAVTPYVEGGALTEIDDEHGALRGVLVVLPTEGVRAARDRRKALLGSIDDIVDAALTAIAGGGAPGRPTLSAYGEIDAARIAVAAYVMRFALFRTGECRIWFDLGGLLGRDLATAPATPEELAVAEKLPAQAYYFLKDLLHAHYHHDPKSDQILPLTRLQHADDDEAVRRAEVRWRYASLRGLVRVVVELRQGRSLQGHKRALGIIAYADAFQSVLARAIRTRGGSPVFAGDGKLIPYEFESLTRSIEASDQTMESVTTSRLQLFAIEVGILLSALALWAGAVQIQPILCGSRGVECPKVGPSPVVSLVNSVVANPLGFTVSLLALGFLLFVMFFRGTGAIPYAERFLRFMKGFADALATQISKWTRGSDKLGWVLSLALLALVAWSSAKLAYWLVPKTHVPAVDVRGEAASPGPWSSLATYVGKPVGASGLLSSSPVGQDLRNLLGADYLLHVTPLQPAPLRRVGDLFYAVSTDRSDADGSYVIFDSASGRMEAATRVEGRLHRHRSPGGELRVPPEVRRFLGRSVGSDADVVPVEAPRCDLVQSGRIGRTIQLSGALRPSAFCTYRIPLQARQTLALVPASARGLYVSVVDGSGSRRIARDFVADASATYVVRVGWDGWIPARGEAVRDRPFFVRLEIR